MPDNPLIDVWAFLIGNTGDYDALGPSKYLLVGLFWALITGSVAIAAANWSRDPEQRTGKHVAIWLMRAVAAGMWFQGSIWKLPLPVSGAFMHWTGALADYTAIPFHAAIVRDVFLPGISVIQPLVYLTEVTFAASLLLGFGVRLIGIVAVLFTLHLWIGLYNDPTEWPWTYAAIVFAHGMFAAAQAGRSLGLDNLLNRSPLPVFARHPRLQQAYELAS
jgi:uncharacterized membrane protein YphA (DoxX/SURF4 family)